MKTDWRGTIIDVRELQLTPGSVKENDLVLTPRGDYAEVITVQKDCPSLENLSSRFIMLTLQTREGTIVPMRTGRGLQKVRVLRPKKRVIFV
jgi:hypothetical protein